MLREKGKRTGDDGDAKASMCLTTFTAYEIIFFSPRPTARREYLI